MKEIIMNMEPLQNRAAVLEGGELMDIFIERKGSEGLVGNIYKGKVDNILAGMQAAFVDIGLDKNAFLYAGDILADKKDFEFGGLEGAKMEGLNIKKLLRQGQDIIVQVLKEPVGSKGARVTTALTLPGRKLVLMPTFNYVGVSRRIDDEGERSRLKELVSEIKKPDIGYIVRTCAKGATREELLAEMRLLEERWQEISGHGVQWNPPCLLHREESLLNTIIRDWMDDSVERLLIDDQSACTQAKKALQLNAPALAERVQYFDKPDNIFRTYGLESKLKKLLERRVWLDNGAYLIIDQTEALTVIDVNTGKFTGKNNLSTTILETNLIAAKEIARQLRLRSIGGIIIIDFIDMDSDEGREKVLVQLAEAVSGDKIKTNIVGFTGLGLVEMTRKKTRNNYSFIMQKLCPYCEGDGRILNEDSVLVNLLLELERLFAHTIGTQVILRLHPLIAEALEKEENAAQFRERFPQKQLFIRTDFALHMEDFNVTLLPEGESPAQSEGMKKLY